MAKGHKSPTGDANPPEKRKPEASKEDGYYLIVEYENGDFDWTAKDPEVDPPVGQAQLAAEVKQLYDWTVDNISDDTEYTEFRRRLRDSFTAGAVASPIDKRARNTIEALQREVVQRADDIIGRRAARASIIYLSIGTVFGVASVLFWLNDNDTTRIIFHYCMLMMMAAGAAAIVVRRRDEIININQFDAGFKRYRYLGLNAAEGLIVVLGVAVVIQNRWVTLTIGATPVDINKDPIIAMGIGFLLGLANNRLVDFISPLFDRALASTRGRRRRATPGARTNRSTWSGRE
jgi:hypothetical protein